MERSPAIAALVHDMYRAVSTGDAGTLTGMLTARDGMLFIGTDPEEWFEDPETICAMLTGQASAGLTVRAGSVTAYEEGTVGWAADQGAFVLPDGTEMPFRITVVFHRENGAWKVVQEHASVAVTNEAALGVSI